MRAGTSKRHEPISWDAPAVANYSPVTGQGQRALREGHRQDGIVRRRTTQFSRDKDSLVVSLPEQKPRRSSMLPAPTPGLTGIYKPPLGFTPITSQGGNGAIPKLVFGASNATPPFQSTSVRTVVPNTLTDPGSQAAATGRFKRLVKSSIWVCPSRKVALPVWEPKLLSAPTGGSTPVPIRFTRTGLQSGKSFDERIFGRAVQVDGSVLFAWAILHQSLSTHR